FIDLAIVAAGVFSRAWFFNSRTSCFVHSRLERPSGKPSLKAFCLNAPIVRFVNLEIVATGVCSREWFLNSRNSSFVHSRPRVLFLPPVETLAVFCIERAI